MDDRRELRVRVPHRLVAGLYRLKLLEGIDMSRAVSEAIDEYLAGQPTQAPALAEEPA